eukprot:Platyproteum_vivax@DN12129_c0_g1_i1.p1
MAKDKVLEQLEKTRLVWEERHPWDEGSHRVDWLYAELEDMLHETDSDAAYWGAPWDIFEWYSDFVIMEMTGLKSRWAKRALAFACVRSYHKESRFSDQYFMFPWSVKPPKVAQPFDDPWNRKPDPKGSILGSTAYLTEKYLSDMMLKWEKDELVPYATILDASKEVTGEDYSSTVHKKNKDVLVFFLVKETKCHHCDSVKQLKGRLSHHFRHVSKLEVRWIHGDVQKISEPLNIGFFPALKLYKMGEKEPATFKGKYGLQEVIAWLEKESSAVENVSQTESKQRRAQRAVLNMRGFDDLSPLSIPKDKSSEEFAELVEYMEEFQAYADEQTKRDEAEEEEDDEEDTFMSDTNKEERLQKNIADVEKMMAGVAAKKSQDKDEL